MTVAEILLDTLSMPQWGFVFHLVILLCLLACLGMTLAVRREIPPKSAGLLAGWIGLLIVLRLPPLADMDQLHLVFSSYHLDRSLQTASLAIICLGLPEAWGAQRRSRILVAGMLVILALAWGAAGPRLLGGEAGPAIAWSIWQMTLCVCAVPALNKGSIGRNQIGVYGGILLLAVAAALLEIVAPESQRVVPIWEKLSSLFVYPMLAILIFLFVTERLKGSRFPLRASHSSSTDSAAESLMSLLDAGDELPLSISPLSNPDGADVEMTIRESASTLLSPILKALDADEGGIGVIEGNAGEVLRFLAVTPASRGHEKDPPCIQLNEQLALQRSLRRQDSTLIPTETDSVQMQHLFSALGSSSVGYLLVQPILLRGRPLGALIAGRSRRETPFPEAATQLAPLLGEILAGLLFAPKQIEEYQTALNEKDSAFQSSQSHWDSRLEGLDRELRSEQESSRLFVSRLAELERDFKKKQSEMDSLTALITLQEEDKERNRRENQALMNKMDSLAREKMKLEDEIRGYRAQIMELERLLRENGGT